jgi:hypothetical protein
MSKERAVPSRTASAKKARNYAGLKTVLGIVGRPDGGAEVYRKVDLCIC